MKIPAFFQTKPSLIFSLPLHTSPRGSGLISVEAAKHILQKALQEQTVKSKPFSPELRARLPPANSLPLERYREGQELSASVALWSATQAQAGIPAKCLHSTMEIQMEMSSGPHISGKFHPQSLLFWSVPAVPRGCIPPDQTKIPAEGWDKIVSAKDTEPGQSQCTCISKFPFHRAHGQKVAKSWRALTGGKIPEKGNSTLGNHCLFVAGKAVRNIGNEGLVLERQESSNLKILLEVFLCLSKAKAVTMCVPTFSDTRKTSLEK